jgi:hypothetical protein
LACVNIYTNTGAEFFSPGEFRDEAHFMAKLEKLTAGIKAAPAKKLPAASAKKAPAKKTTAKMPRNRAEV